ncbi:MAG: hypothetical protein JXA77_10610 [Bacteroidales bacterium]|nr:hypothetical protein [Bacteroidales bacterium]MBN2820526.1 hypothetical protein [Bacteroidales bacterium]
MQRDYLLREIEKIGAMLRMLIRRAVEQKDKNEEETETEELLNDFAAESGFEIDELLNSGKEELDEIVNIKNGFNPENTEYLGDFLVELAEISELVEKPRYLLKALELYQIIDEKTHTFSLLRAKKMDSIRNSLKN